MSALISLLKSDVTKRGPQTGELEDEAGHDGLKVQNEKETMLDRPDTTLALRRFRSGASVRRVGLCAAWRRRGAGAAGGERYSTASRIALAGLAAGLRGLPAAEPLEVRTDSAELIGFAGLLASLGRPADVPPEDDLDLWAQIISLAAGRRIGLIRAPRDPATPTGFAAAWAELARDKAKATGPFTAAIPRANLAKVPGLGVG